MIDLAARNDRQGYGIEAVLQSDRTPYRRVQTAAEARGRLLLIATPEIGEDLARLAESRRALIIGKLPRKLLGMFDLSHPGKMLHNPRCTWCGLPLGEAITMLLTEDYAPQPDQQLTPRWIHSIYYSLSEWTRGVVQRSVYRRLQHSLANHPDASDYPMDRTGLVLMELVRTLIRQAAGGLVRIDRWPSPYRAAATLTHDIEPTKYSYTEGFNELRRTVGELRHPASFGLVSSQAKRYLDASRLEDIAIYCHGLEHRGETVAGSKKEIAAAIGSAKEELERLAGRKVSGFRSPRLDRSADMFEALDESGFTYSSSAPDVDRESMARYGSGVRVNIPFRPPLGKPGAYRRSRCLELPVSAPDCIQPLFAGETEQELREAVRAKIDFIAETGGLYAGIVHAGVFGSGDSERRMNHLRFVARELDRPGLWLASVEDIATWWCRREQIHVTRRAGGWAVENHGAFDVQDLRFVVEDAYGNIINSTELPSLRGGSSASVGSDFSFDKGVVDYATSV